jgi:protein phosphatase
VGCDGEAGLWLVADGMGGHAAGEVASRIAVDTILERCGMGDALQTATLQAHAAIVAHAERNEAQKGMGTTSVALRVDDRRGEVVWVGDSRAYLLRDGRLTPLTRDHSFMQLMIDRQHLTEEQARNHPRRNVVTQVLGFNEPQPDRVETILQDGDLVMLCSDGLYDELEDAQMLEIIQAGGSLAAQAGRLVDAACDHGGRDNISVILVRYSNQDANTLQRVAGGLPGAEKAAQEKAAQEAPDGHPQHRGFLPDQVFWGIVAALVVFILFLLLKGGDV